MNQPVLKIGVILTLILVLSFSVMGARGNDCNCLEAPQSALKSQKTVSSRSLTGCCDTQPPPPSSNMPCPCQDSACTLFQEKERAGLIIAQLNGFDFDSSFEPQAEQNFWPNHRDQNPSDLRIKTAHVLATYVLRC